MKRKPHQNRLSFDTRGPRCVPRAAPHNRSATSQVADTCDAPLCLVCTRSLTVGIATAAAGIGYRGLTRDYCPVHAEQITRRPADATRDVLDHAAADAARWWVTEGKTCEEAQPATAPE